MLGEFLGVDLGPALAEPLVHEDGPGPQHDTNSEENARDLVLHRGTVGERSDEEATREGADDRKDGRHPEMLVLHRLFAQDEHGDVDDGEHAQQQQRGGAAEFGDLTDERDEAEREDRGEDDGNVRCAPRGVNLAERGGSTPSRLMPYSNRLAISMLISAVLATANMVMNAKIPIGNPGAPA